MEGAHARQHQAFGRDPRQGDAQQAAGVVAHPIQIVQRGIDLGQGGAQLVQKALSMFGQAHTPGGAMKQAHPQFGFQPPQGLRQSRGRDAQFRCRASEAGVAGDAGEGGQGGKRLR